jgi:hypothetical protein
LAPESLDSQLAPNQQCISSIKLKNKIRPIRNIISKDKPCPEAKGGTHRNAAAGAHTQGGLAAWYA